MVKMKDTPLLLIVKRRRLSSEMLTAMKAPDRVVESCPGDNLAAVGSTNLF
jgi:hypothetical protein